MKGRVATSTLVNEQDEGGSAKRRGGSGSHVAKGHFGCVLLTVVGIFAYKKYWKGGASKDVDEA